jgi:cell division protein ZapA
MKQIEVQIMGQSYLLGCTEGGESQMMAAVEKVDTAMCKIRDAAKIKARERIAVLAALNLAFDHIQKSEAPMHDSTAMAVETGEVHKPDATASHSLDLLIAKLDTALAEDGRLF